MPEGTRPPMPLWLGIISIGCGLAALGLLGLYLLHNFVAIGLTAAEGKRLTTVVVVAFMAALLHNQTYYDAPWVGQSKNVTKEID